MAQKSDLAMVDIVQVNSEPSPGKQPRTLQALECVTTTDSPAKQIS